MSTPTSSHSRKGGFTLIEVAIALALFVIGALAIVRIFPPALSVIRNNESRVTATQMGEGTLARLRNRYSPPPEAVFDVDNSGNWQDYPGAVVGTVNRNSSLPQSPIDSDFDNSALGHFRYIYGEPHYIASGQFILLNRPRAAATSTGVAVPVTAFQDEIVDGVQLNSNGYLDFSNAYIVSSGASFADDDPAPLAVSNNIVTPPDGYRRPDTKYYVSYRWRECTDAGCTTNPPIKGVSEEPMSLPADADWTGSSGRVLPTTLPGFNKAIPGTIRVRVRKSITVTPVSTGDPQNAVVSISAVTPGTYYTSYLSSDWRTMVYDNAPAQKVGAATTGIIRLPIGGLDETFIPTGFLTRSDQKVSVTPLTTASTDRKTGEIEYTIPAWDSPRVRTIYRTLDGWVHQLSVAPRTYYHYDANRTGDDFPTEPWREYHWSSGDPSVIYFRPSEAGKSVALTFLNSSGVKVSSICSIEDDLIAQPGSVVNGFIGPGNSTSRVARLFITDAVGNEIPANSILSVQGISVRARTAWLNNDRYNQVIVPGYRSLTQSN